MLVTLVVIVLIGLRRERESSRTLSPSDTKLSHRPDNAIPYRSKGRVDRGYISMWMCDGLRTTENGRRDR